MVDAAHRDAFLYVDNDISREVGGRHQVLQNTVMGSGASDGLNRGLFSLIKDRFNRVCDDVIDGRCRVGAESDNLTLVCAKIKEELAKEQMGGNRRRIFDGRETGRERY